MWTVETFDKRVDKELAELPRDLFARFLRIAELLKEYGPATVGMPHVRPLTGSGGLWEIRMSARANIARALYVKARGRRLVVVLAFEKKTQKTPRAVLETARRRAKEVT